MKLVINSWTPAEITVFFFFKRLINYGADVAELVLGTPQTLSCRPSKDHEA